MKENLIFKEKVSDMDKISIKIRLLYSEMGKAEKQVADWIEANPGKIISLSIVELAEQCRCSEATIVRFSKRLGMSGFQELKISLAAEGGGSSVSTHITGGDGAYQIYEKVCNDIFLSLEKTKSSLDREAIAAAAERISNAGTVALFGLGNSASLALDGAHKFLRAGLQAVSYSDNHMQVIAASHLKPGDVAIAITHSGSSRDIVDALKLAREHGVATIAITNAGKSPVMKYADIVLATSAEETRYNILGLNSRIVQLAIIDALYYYVVYNHSDAAMESIKETERALLNKKF